MPRRRVFVLRHLSPRFSSIFSPLFGLASAAFVLAGACGNGKTPTSPDAGTPSTGFVHAQGTGLLGPDDQPLFLKGVSLGNQVWSDVALPTDHAEIDFARLAAMGANSTRFLLNYRTLEDDNAPFVYKQAGWDWIDQNVAWARAHGIRLILNVHVPEGGFQSNGEGGALWSDSRNQDRLTALWSAIAAHYADEPTIAGYGLLNEPAPLMDRAQWASLAQRLLDAIRVADMHHLVVVERTNSVAGSYGQDQDMNLFLVNDPAANVMYEFHFYEPSEYTFQLQPWNNTPDGGIYPDSSKVAGVNEMWLNVSTFDSPAVPPGSTDWTYYEGTRVAAAKSAIVVGKPTLVGQALGQGVVAYDDLTIKEYDPSGTFVRDIAHLLPNSASGWYFWSNDNVGKASLAADCKTSDHCLTLTGTDDDASYGGYGFYFVPRPQYQYSLSGWMKGTNLPAKAVARLRIDLLGSSTPVRSRDKAGLAALMAPYLAWGQRHAVPLFLGEFGVYRACFTNDKGGLTWVKDVYDLANGDGDLAALHVAALSYHQYHEDAFALYYGDGGPVDPQNANQPLIDLLTAKLSGTP